MRMLTLTVLALVACGQKKPPEAPAAVPEVATEPTPAPAPEPEPEPEPEPMAEVPGPPNADFQATLNYADGRRITGQVVRVERGEDWYGEEWTDHRLKLTVSLESGAEMRDAKWEEIKSITVVYGKRDEISCQYDSAYSPWMYICVLPTQSTAKLADGSTWSVTTRNPWKFTFADEKDEVFYVFKLPARRQDTAEGMRSGLENYTLYGELQTDVMTAKESALTSVTITAP